MPRSRHQRKQYALSLRSGGATSGGGGLGVTQPTASTSTELSTVSSKVIGSKWPIGPCTFNVKGSDEPCGELHLFLSHSCRICTKVRKAIARANGTRWVTQFSHSTSEHICGRCGQRGHGGTTCMIVATGASFHDVKENNQDQDEKKSSYSMYPMPHQQYPYHQHQHHQHHQHHHQYPQQYRPPYLHYPQQSHPMYYAHYPHPSTHYQSTPSYHQVYHEVKSDDTQNENDQFSESAFFDDQDQDWDRDQDVDNWGDETQDVTTDVKADDDCKDDSKDESQTKPTVATE